MGSDPISSGVTGISWHRAPIELRERVAKVAHAIAEESGSIVISTCHRVEFYFDGKGDAKIVDLLTQRVGSDVLLVLYTYFGREAFLHLAHVVAGLDSVLKGEGEIQRQVKLAYEMQKTRASEVLHFLFQKSLFLSKEMRSLFLLYQKGVALERAICEMGKGVFSSQEKVHLLLIGFSEMNRRIARILKEAFSLEITFITRDVKAAWEFAALLGANVLDRSSLELWNQYDWIVSSTTSNHFLLSPRPERGQTRLICDLSVPRSVDPRIGESVELVTLEKIEGFIRLERKIRDSETREIGKLLTFRVDEYITLFHVRCAKKKRIKTLRCQGIEEMESHLEYSLSQR